MTQHELVRAYGVTDEPTRYGGLKIESGRALALLDELDMHIPRPGGIIDASEFSKFRLDINLRQFGRFMLLYRNITPAGTAHAVVPYKTAELAGNWGETFWRMDPGVGENNMQRVSDLHHRNEVLFLVFTRSRETTI